MGCAKIRGASIMVTQISLGLIMTDKELYRQARAGRREPFTALEGAPGYKKVVWDPDPNRNVNVRSHYVDDGREPEDESQVLTGGY